MTSAQIIPLKWTTQLQVIPSKPGRLNGDKIILPQQALQKLLDAATTPVPANTGLPRLTNGLSSAHPYTSRTGIGLTSLTFERQQQLPHPLTFRLVNPENGNIVYAGVREFSAPDGQVEVSPFLQEALGLKTLNNTPKVIDFDDDDIEATVDDKPKVTIHAQKLAKGLYVRFRPLEAGYDPEDWKALLERYMRDTFTTITKGEVLAVPSGREVYRFLVDKVEPEGEAVCIVDTDLEVDIEALNEEQARETLKRRLDKSKNLIADGGESSPGGDLLEGQAQHGQVAAGSYVDYSLKEWDRSKDVEVEVESEEAVVDVLVSPFNNHQRSKPRAAEHVFSEFSDRPLKRIRISHNNPEVTNAEALCISIHGYEAAADHETVSSTQVFKYAISIATAAHIERLDENLDADQPATNADETRCSNCHQYVPQRTLFLHQNFCLRNNVSCKHCSIVFLKSSGAWKHHWHCPEDDMYGSNQVFEEKHIDLHHTETACPACQLIVPSTVALARHRTTTCPAKPILCQFCHLVVPQYDPSTDSLGPEDPEILFSGMTPHEYSDGARTTECHLCGRILRLRDMSAHLRNHDLERLSRSAPRLCRNIICGQTVDIVYHNGEMRRASDQTLKDHLGLCETCFGPLYNSSFDPDGRALKRRTERRYLTQLVTGCGKAWCINEFCATGRQHLSGTTLNEPTGAEQNAQLEKLTIKSATSLIKPEIVDLQSDSALHFCVNEKSQERRRLATFLEMQSDWDGKNGWTLPWCVAALEVSRENNADKAGEWLRNWAPRRGEGRS